MLPGIGSLVGIGKALNYLVSATSAEKGFAGTSLVINKPSGTTSGDTLVALMSGTSATTWTGDTGWTERLDEAAGGGLRIAELTAGGSEPSSYTFTASGAGVAIGQIICLRGVSFDTIAGATTAITGNGNIAMSAITSAGGIILALVATENQSGTITHSTPSGMYKIATSINSTASRPAVSSFWQNVDAGSTGTRTTTVSGAADGSSGILIGYKP